MTQRKHAMQLHAAPFAMMKSGRKTVELRLWDEKRQSIRGGDTVVFTNTADGETLETTVLRLHRFDSFDALYKSLPLLQCGYTEETVESATPADMEAYYPADKQAKYGVVGIEICPVTRRGGPPMKTITILGANRHETYTRTRNSARGVWIRDGEILLCHERVTDIYATPGGGVESGEDASECLVREMEEETGYIVRPGTCFLRIEEYYEEYRYITDVFLCEGIGKGVRRLTSREERVGMECRFLPIADAVALFSRHAEYDGIDEEKRGIYEREYIILTHLPTEIESAGMT